MNGGGPRQFAATVKHLSPDMPSHGMSLPTVGGHPLSVSGQSDLTQGREDRRKLVAVLYADMVGYSRLIGLDDAGTLQRLRSLRQNLIDPAIEGHGGRVVQTGGDSLLVVFDSIDGAVRCAVGGDEVECCLGVDRLLRRHSIRDIIDYGKEKAQREETRQPAYADRGITLL